MLGVNTYIYCVCVKFVKVALEESQQSVLGGLLVELLVGEQVQEAFPAVEEHVVPGCPQGAQDVQ